MFEYSSCYGSRYDCINKSYILEYFIIFTDSRHQTSNDCKKLLVNNKVSFNLHKSHCIVNAKAMYVFVLIDFFSNVE